jgi:hypothetical protein
MAKIPVTWNGLNSKGQPLKWGDPELVWNGFLPETPTPTKKMQLRVQLGFTNAADHSVAERTEAVIGGLYVSELWNPLPAGTSFPVTEADLQAGLDSFTTAMAAADAGGPADTAAKNNRRDALVALLRKLAGFVQSNHGNDMAKLLASGFEAVSTNRARTPLEKPSILDILNGNTGQLVLRVGAIANSQNYEVQFALIGAGGTPGPWTGAGLFSNSRSMPVNGLTPGSEYTFRVRAVGGSTGYSDWSDTRSHRSM